MATEKCILSLDAVNTKPELAMDILLENLKYFIEGEIEDVAKECFLVNISGADRKQNLGCTVWLCQSSPAKFSVSGLHSPELIAVEVKQKANLADKDWPGHTVL